MAKRTATKEELIAVEIDDEVLEWHWEPYQPTGRKLTDAEIEMLAAELQEEFK